MSGLKLATALRMTRPPAMVSRLASLRARLYGELYDVEAVSTKPMSGTAAAIAEKSTIGSNRWLGPREASRCSAGWSETKTASSPPDRAISADRR